MFFEVCFLSFGLLAGSELYKKIRWKSGKDDCRSDRLKISDLGPSQKPLLPLKDDSQTDATDMMVHRQDIATIALTLESLSHEIALLKKEIVNLKITENQPAGGPVQSGSRKISRDVNQSVKSQLFKQLIEENIQLRKT